MKRQYIIIDTESNGPDRWAEVWQASWQVVNEEFKTIKADGGYLPPVGRMCPTAKRITGLDRTTLKQKAESAEAVYTRLLGNLKGCQAVIGHSVDIDIERLIHDASKRCSSPLAEEIKKAFAETPYYDTMAHTMSFVGKTIERYERCGWGKIWYTKLAYPGLGDLAYQLQIQRDDVKAHTADGDVEITRRCLVAMSEQCPYLLEDLLAGEIENPSTKSYWVRK